MTDIRIPIIHMTEGNILCRCPESLYGKRFSVISLGLCNFHCPYCQLGGGLPRTDNRIPLAVDVNLREVEKFIESQVAKGNPVKISGGEPTVNMPLALHLIDYIKACGGYSCADTSGWSPEATLSLAERADQIAIDLKGPPRYAPKVTGVDLDMCWYYVLESLRLSAATRAILEVRTVFFDFTTLKDLAVMANHIPPRSYWLIRRFLTDWVPFDKYAESSFPGSQACAVKYPSWLSEPTRDKMRQTVAEALRGDLFHKSNCVVLLDSPRDSMGEVFES